MAKKKTHEQFIEEMKEKHPNIEVLGKYINSRTKIICVCLIDYEIWEAVPYDLLRYGCSVCSGKKRNHYSFIKELNKINPNIKVLDRYKGIHDNIKCKCEICGHIWNAEPNGLLHKNSGCPQCVINKKTKTHEGFIKELSIINPNIEVLGKYINSSTPILCRCKIDGYEWSPKPNDLLSGKGCLQCAIRSNRGENNPRYNPNLTDEEREKKRKTFEYCQWLKEVYERDNYTCQCCGSSKSGTLNAHHKDGYNWCKERRTDVTNGTTLCENCHKTFHSIYGYGDNTEQQFEEFLNNNNNNNKRDII